MISAGLAIPAAILVPLVGCLAIWLLDKQPNLREAATLITGAVLLFLTLVVFAAVGDGERPGYFVFDVIEGLPLAFQVEPLGAMFAVIASGLWLVNSIYSIGYMRGGNEKHQTRFYMSFAIAIS
ncbi:MAG: monovalent cation/H+ antiporter subunit D family protein, partial [Pseudomonadota bacterium]